MKIIDDISDQSPADRIKIIGGPLDGETVPVDDYFDEGDIFSIDTIEHAKKNVRWSAESVYRFKNGVLLYDSKATLKRRHTISNQK